MPLFGDKYFGLLLGHTACMKFIVCPLTEIRIVNCQLLTPKLVKLRSCKLRLNRSLHGQLSLNIELLSRRDEAAYIGCRVEAVAFHLPHGTFLLSKNDLRRLPPALGGRLSELASRD
ncbi:hypothetical protein ACTHQ6_15395 [Arthrobacter sp. SAFR-179]|uniref:hypothetical protein n=1 Tax=Arthrobacter sp. SAFR-179 TaxID=3387279 RepID=UPI003F7C9DF3